MAMTVQEISAAVRALPFEEKLALFEELQASVYDETPAEVLEAQLAEVARRREEVLSGKVQLIPGEQVERELDQLLNEISRVPRPGTR